MHVLMARGAVHVVALMPLNSFHPNVLFTTVRTATAKKAHGGLWVGHGFASMVNSQMCLVASLSEKVLMTLLATSCGLLALRVSCLEIRALFLATGPALLFLVAAMLSLGVIGFPTVGTYITGPEKPW